MCHLNAPGRTNHQPVHFVLVVRNLEHVLINHGLAAATILPWGIALAQLSTLFQVWTVQQRWLSVSR